VTRILMIVVAMVALAGMARAEDSVLRSLPTNLQKYIEGVRAKCSGKHVTRGDEGLKTFRINGAPALLVDTYCGTGDTHSVEIFARSGGTWRKVLSTWTSAPRLNLERGAFRSMNLKVFAGDHGCPANDRPRATCDTVVRWDGARFTYGNVVRILPVGTQGEWCLVMESACRRDGPGGYMRVTPDGFTAWETECEIDDIHAIAHEKWRVRFKCYQLGEDGPPTETAEETWHLWHLDEMPRLVIDSVNDNGKPNKDLYERYRRSD
jgi:hypothetical protein